MDKGETCPLYTGSIVAHTTGGSGVKQATGWPRGSEVQLSTPLHTTSRTLFLCGINHRWIIKQQMHKIQLVPRIHEVLSCKISTSAHAAISRYLSVHNTGKHKLAVLKIFTSHFTAVLGKCHFAFIDPRKAVININICNILHIIIFVTSQGNIYY